MKVSLILLPVAAQSARYGLLRVESSRNYKTVESRAADAPSQRSLNAEDFEAFFRGLLGGPGDISMSSGLSLSASMPTSPFGWNLSMPLDGMSMPTLSPVSPPPSPATKDSIEPVDPVAPAPVAEAPTPGPSAASPATTDTGDVAQTAAENGSSGGSSTKKSGTSTAAIVGTLSAVGAVAFAGFVVRKQVAKNRSDVSVGDQSDPQSLL